MICLDNVTYGYQEVLALRDVSLHIASGATTALIGPIGSGKSTLLKLIAGLVPAAVLALLMQVIFGALERHWVIAK